MFAYPGAGFSKMIAIMTVSGFQGAPNRHGIFLRQSVGLPGQAPYATPGAASAVITEFDMSACLYSPRTAKHNVDADATLSACFCQMMLSSWPEVAFQWRSAPPRWRATPCM